MRRLERIRPRTNGARRAGHRLAVRASGDPPGRECRRRGFFAVPLDRLDEITDALEVCESFGVDTRVSSTLPARAGDPFVEERFPSRFTDFPPPSRGRAFSPPSGGSMSRGRPSPAGDASVLLVLAVVVKLTSPGPVIFSQGRPGFTAAASACTSSARWWKARKISRSSRAPQRDERAGLQGRG